MPQATRFKNQPIMLAIWFCIAFFPTLYVHSFGFIFGLLIFSIFVPPLLGGAVRNHTQKYRYLIPVCGIVLGMYVAETFIIDAG